MLNLLLLSLLLIRWVSLMVCFVCDSWLGKGCISIAWMCQVVKWFSLHLSSFNSRTFLPWFNGQTFPFALIDWLLLDNRWHTILPSSHRKRSGLMGAAVTWAIQIEDGDNGRVTLCGLCCSHALTNHCLRTQCDTCSLMCVKTLESLANMKTETVISSVASYGIFKSVIDRHARLSLSHIGLCWDWHVYTVCWPTSKKKVRDSNVF